MRNWMVLENARRYGRGEKKKEKWNRNEIAFWWYYFPFESADRSQVEHEFVLLEAKFTHLFKVPRLFHSVCSFVRACVRSYDRFFMCVRFALWERVKFVMRSYRCHFAWRSLDRLGGWSRISGEPLIAIELLFSFCARLPSVSLE